MRKRLLIAAAALSTLLLPAVLLAGHAKGHDHPKAGAFLDHVAEVLSLTAAQKDQIHGFFASHHEELAAQISRLRTAHQALREAVHAPVLDEPAVRSAARSMGEAKEELAVSHARLMGELRRVLTAEQQQKAHELLAHMHGKCDGFLEHLQEHFAGK